MTEEVSETADIYDDPRVQPKEIEFNDVVLDQPGDHVRGAIIKMEILNTKFGPTPKYTLFDLDNECERGMLCGKVDLWRKLHALRPQVGDIINVTLVEHVGRRQVFQVTSEPPEAF